MSERIRQLAKQTGYIWHTSGEPQIYEFTPEKLEKFAELIIKECATIADKWVDDTDNGQNYPSEIIKQHFGVKE
jgi:hypothetical protein